MVEIRIKTDKLKEIDDFMVFFRELCFPGYVAVRMSKAYPMRNGQYKVFLECLTTAEYNSFKSLNVSNESVFLNEGITTPGKKRGRKPKGLKLL